MVGQLGIHVRRGYSAGTAVILSNIYFEAHVQVQDVRYIIAILFSINTRRLYRVGTLDNGPTNTGCRSDSFVVLFELLHLFA